MSGPFQKLSKAMLGGALTVLWGLALWFLPLGNPWAGASYDYLFFFIGRAPTNPVVLVQMEMPSAGFWDRDLHTALLERLAKDHCRLVVLDVFFRSAEETAKDQKLAAAMNSLPAVVLAAWKDELVMEHARGPTPDLAGVQPLLPSSLFLQAAHENWGVAWFNPDADLIVRRHWPFPAPDRYPSLPWTAARIAGARLNSEPAKQWLRYYSAGSAWDRLSYSLALTQAPDYFRNKIVFFGNKPKTTTPDGELDEFRTPATRWTHEATGGVELIATAFLNLLNEDWLRRLPTWCEILILGVAGILFGAGLMLLSHRAALLVSAGGAILTSIGFISMSQSSNYWFPWLMISGGQIPFALAWAIFGSKRRESAATAVLSDEQETQVSPGAGEEVPDAPEYELFTPAFAEGAYGKIWLARNAVGQWQALKAIYLSRFGNDPRPFEREFAGIKRYKPISDKHAGLVRVDFVSKPKDQGYFYYVMELGDALVPGWQEDPSKYKPRDLAVVRNASPGRRLPLEQCVWICAELADALQFLHQQGLIHRDIKPQNIIFVQGRPKFADVGLVAELRPPGAGHTLVGTPGYMPPAPEPPGTEQADIYALGMLLYVILTGKDPQLFPELAITLAEAAIAAKYLRVNSVILKACNPDLKQRYASASEISSALHEIQGAQVAKG